MLLYQQKQKALFGKIENDFRKGKIFSSIVVPVKDYVNDALICLTGVVFLPEKIKRSISKKIIEPLRKEDNNQYYYLPESLHLTLQNVRIISNPPFFTKKDIVKVKKVFEEVIPKFRSFSFELRNLFELPTSLSICGFCDEVLKYLVLELREKLQKAGVPDNKKYASDEVFFGNITICRYTKKPTKDFLAKIKELKNIEIGRFVIKEVSLITTNKVCHPSKTQIIEIYKLKN